MSNVSIVLLQTIPLESFEGQASDGTFVPVIPGGHSIPLTFSNRGEYFEYAIRYRLQESARQVTAVREGLCGIIPVPVLSLMTGKCLEELVCGSPVIEVSSIKKIVR